MGTYTCAGRTKSIGRRYTRTAESTACGHAIGQIKGRFSHTNSQILRAGNRDFLHIKIHHVHRRHRHFAEVVVRSGDGRRHTRDIYINAHRHRWERFKIQGYNGSPVSKAGAVRHNISIKPGESQLIAHRRTDQRCIAIYRQRGVAQQLQFRIVPVDAEIEGTDIVEVGHFDRHLKHVAAGCAGRAFCSQFHRLAACNHQYQFITCSRTGSTRVVRCEGKGDVACIIERRRIGSIQVVGIGCKCAACATVVPGAVGTAVDNAAQRSISVDTSRLIRTCIGDSVGAAGGGIDRNIEGAGIRATGSDIRIGVSYGIGRAINSRITVAGHAGARERAARRQCTHSGQVQRQIIHTYRQVFRTVYHRKCIDRDIKGAGIRAAGADLRISVCHCVGRTRSSCITRAGYARTAERATDRRC